MALSRFSFGDQQTGANQRRRWRFYVGDQGGVRIGAFLIVGDNEEVRLHFHVGHDVAGLVLLVAATALSIQNQVQTALLHQIQAIAGDLER